jgi:hypothetical protein
VNLQQWHVQTLHSITAIFDFGWAAYSDFLVYTKDAWSQQPHAANISRFQYPDKQQCLNNNTSSLMG